MAKLKVKQIEDLGIVAAENGVKTIQIGPGAPNSIVPLTGVSTTEGEGSVSGGYISGLGVSGNELVITRTALPTLDIPEVAGQFVLNAVVDETNKHKINLTKGTFDVSTNAEGAQTGSLIFGADNVLKVNDAWVKGKLATVASTGKAEDVSIADTGNLIEATTVEGALAELAQKTTDITIHGQEAIVVADATGEGATGKVVSLKLANGEQVLSQDAAGLKSTLDLTYDSTDKKIKLWGISETAPIATVDATDFIKDGMLADAEIITASNEEGLTPGKRYIKFTFKTYQYGVEGEETLKVEYLDVESLIDTYTSGNEWIVIDQTANSISHKTQGAFTQEEGEEEPQTAFGGNVAEGAEADVTIEGAGQSAKFTVPSFVVDAAGHVTVAEDRVVKVTLPAAQTITGETATTQGNYINVKVTATKGENNDNYTLSTTSNVTTQTMAGIAVEGAADGLATASDVKEYVDGKIAGQSPTTITMTQIVRGTANASSVDLAGVIPSGYTIDGTFTVGFLNGQLVPSVTVSGTTVTYAAYDGVAYEDGDRFDVIATVKKDVEVIGYTAPTQNA